MPRKSTSMLDTMIHHAINAPLAVVEADLITVATIVKARKAGGLREPSLTPAAPRERKPRQPRQTTIHEAAAPVAEQPATPRRTRGPNKPKTTARPPVPADVPAPPAGAPLPEGGDEPMGDE